MEDTYTETYTELLASVTKRLRDTIPKGKAPTFKQAMKAILDISNETKVFINENLSEILADKAIKEIRSGLALIRKRLHGSVHLAVVNHLQDSDSLDLSDVDRIFEVAHRIGARIAHGMADRGVFLPHDYTQIIENAVSEALGRLEESIFEPMKLTAFPSDNRTRKWGDETIVLKPETIARINDRMDSASVAWRR